jgi:hypothetical protein
MPTKSLKQWIIPPHQDIPLRNIVTGKTKKFYKLSSHEQGAEIKMSISQHNTRNKKAVKQYLQNSEGKLSPT